MNYILALALLFLGLFLGGEEPVEVAETLNFTAQMTETWSEAEWDIFGESLEAGAIICFASSGVAAFLCGSD